MAFTVALVASLETLLCVEATDKMDPEKRVTPTNRELLAQGAGNIVAGMIGGLPITQVIVRSSANIQSGVRTKLSAILHGFFLLILVISIPGILNMIPLAVLAAILLQVGYKLAKPALFFKMTRARLETIRSVHGYGAGHCLYRPAHRYRHGAVCRRRSHPDKELSEFALSSQARR